MIFSRDQVALIRQGKLTATLVPATSKIQAGHVRRLRRRYTRHDADGHELDTAIETVTDTRPGGEQIPVMLTVTFVSCVEKIANLTQPVAEACGYRTITGIKDAWRAAHPRLADAKLIRFAVGDLRDPDLYLQRNISRGGDYTTSRHLAIDDLPVLRADELAPLTAAARRRDTARANDPLQRERNQINRSIEAMRDQLDHAPNRKISRALRQLEHQLRTFDRTLKEAS